MPIAPSNDIELYYETHGDPADPALLLVNGFSSQILGWFDGFREALAERGRFVISFDNRDVGLSTHLDGIDVDLAAIGAGTAQAPYDLSTFALDAVGLLDHLGVDKAHIAGSSMGGMIVQQMAIDHPDRVATSPRSCRPPANLTTSNRRPKPWRHFGHRNRRNARRSSNERSRPGTSSAASATSTTMPSLRRPAHRSIACTTQRDSLVRPLPSGRRAIGPRAAQAADPDPGHPRS
ncbi:MAG: alpha/beta hydrolase [Acidimicrobiales bacterium]